MKAATKESLYCTQRDPADPIAQVYQAFCRNLLEKPALVKPLAKKAAREQEEESCKFANALEYLRLLHSLVDSVGAVSAPFSAATCSSSPLALTWSAVGGCRPSPRSSTGCRGTTQPCTPTSQMWNGPQGPGNNREPFGEGGAVHVQGHASLAAWEGRWAA